MKHVIVIGCGPSGMLAAISAARNGAQVTILEAGSRPGRKLLLTGNGRCNITNLEYDAPGVYLSADQKEADILLESVFGQFSGEDTIRFFEEEGLFCTVEHGSYVYPSTWQSTTVLEVLIRTLEYLHVRLKYSEEVIGIEAAGEETPKSSGEGRWGVKTATWLYRADSVIISCGSRSVPSTGSNGTGYELCRMLGMDVTDVLPALTGIACHLPLPDTKAYVPRGKNSTKNSQNPLDAAAGTRTGAVVTVMIDAEKAAKEKGQVQFTQTDLSGIVVFNLSRFVTRALRQGRDVTIRLDLIPDYSARKVELLLKNLKETHPDITLSSMLTGIIPSRLIPSVEYLHRTCGRSLVSALKAFELHADSLRGFDQAQVCAGGVRVTELDPDTLECRSDELKGIYLTGELIDIDGPCGGYNLQWAWSSGYIAGYHASFEG